MLLVVLTTISVILFTIIEYSTKYDTVGFHEPAMALPVGAFAIAGLVDAMVQTYIVCLIGKVFSQPQQQSRGIAYYQLLSASGFTLGFLLCPVSRVPRKVQVILMGIIWSAGAWCLLPVKAADNRTGGATYKPVGSLDDGADSGDDWDDSPTIELQEWASFSDK